MLFNHIKTRLIRNPQSGYFDFKIFVVWIVFFLFLLYYLDTLIRRYLPFFVISDNYYRSITFEFSTYAIWYIPEHYCFLLFWYFFSGACLYINFFCCYSISITHVPVYTGPNSLVFVDILLLSQDWSTRDNVIYSFFSITTTLQLFIRFIII